MITKVITVYSEQHESVCQIFTTIRLKNVDHKEKNQRITKPWDSFSWHLEFLHKIFTAIWPTVVEEFHSKCKLWCMSPCLCSITPSFSGDRNVCATFEGNPSNRCWDTLYYLTDQINFACIFLERRNSKRVKTEAVVFEFIDIQLSLDHCLFQRTNKEFRYRVESTLN